MPLKIIFATYCICAVNKPGPSYFLVLSVSLSQLKMTEEIRSTSGRVPVFCRRHSIICDIVNIYTTESFKLEDPNIMQFFFISLWSWETVLIKTYLSPTEQHGI